MLPGIERGLVGGHSVVPLGVGKRSSEGVLGNVVFLAVLLVVTTADRALGWRRRPSNVSVHVLTSETFEPDLNSADSSESQSETSTTKGWTLDRSLLKLSESESETSTILEVGALRT